MKMQGKLYGIGTGPGDPELITIKAVNALKSADILFVPVTKKEKESFAFEIVKNYVKSDIKIIPLHFPMVKDVSEKERKRKENAEIIKSHMKEHKTGVFVTIGDIMVYSTFFYMYDYLKNDLDIETIPGITSFSLISSINKHPLVMGNKSLLVVPVTKNTDFETELDKSDNIVFMKVSADSKKLHDALIKKRLENSFVLVSKAGTEDEFISRDIGILQSKIPYLSTIIVNR